MFACCYKKAPWLIHSLISWHYSSHFTWPAIRGTKAIFQVSCLLYASLGVVSKAAHVEHIMQFTNNSRHKVFFSFFRKSVNLLVWLVAEGVCSVYITTDAQIKFSFQYGVKQWQVDNLKNPCFKVTPEIVATKFNEAWKLRRSSKNTNNTQIKSFEGKLQFHSFPMESVLENEVLSSGIWKLHSKLFYSGLWLVALVVSANKYRLVFSKEELSLQIFLNLTNEALMYFPINRFLRGPQFCQWKATHLDKYAKNSEGFSFQILVKSNRGLKRRIV